MPTYYKYAETTADSQINWAEIGKGITDMLSNERKIREAKREALDQVSRELGNTLANMPQGEDPNANNVLMGFTDSAQKQRLIDDRLFKSGQMDYRTYIARRQNLVDDTKLTVSLAETYQKSYKEKMERYEQKKSQQLEIEAAKELEGLADFSTSQLYIDPVDCTVKAAKTKKEMVNGQEVVVPDKNNIFGVKSLFKNMTIKYDKFDTNSAVKQAADSFGDVESVIVTAAGIHSNGRVTTLLDKTQRRQFEKNPQAMKAISLYEQSEALKVQQIMDNPYSTSSIMTEDMGYTYVKTPEEVAKNPDKFLLKKLDPNTGRLIAVPTEKQKEKVAEFLKTQIRASFDNKVTAQVTGQLSDQYHPMDVEGAKYKEKLKSAEVFGTMLGNLIAPPSKALFDASVTYYNNAGYDVSVNNGVLTLKAPGKTATTIDLNNKEKISTVNSTLPYFRETLKDLGFSEEAVSEFAKKSGLSKINTSFSADASGVGQTNEGSPRQVFTNIVNTEIKGHYAGGSDTQGVVDFYNDRLNKFGASAEKAGEGYIIITNGGIKSGKLKVGTTQAERQRLSKAIADILNANPYGKNGADADVAIESARRGGFLTSGGVNYGEK